jgi:hypothetical protein
VCRCRVYRRAAAPAVSDARAELILKALPSVESISHDLGRRPGRSFSARLPRLVAANRDPRRLRHAWFQGYLQPSGQAEDQWLLATYAFPATDGGGGARRDGGRSQREDSGDGNDGGQRGRSAFKTASEPRSSSGCCWRRSVARVLSCWRCRRPPSGWSGRPGFSRRWGRAGSLCLFAVMTFVGIGVDCQDSPHPSV